MTTSLSMTTPMTPSCPTIEIVSRYSTRFADVNCIGDVHTLGWEIPTNAVVESWEETEQCLCVLDINILLDFNNLEWVYDYDWDIYYVYDEQYLANSVSG